MDEKIPMGSRARSAWVAMFMGTFLMVFLLVVVLVTIWTFLLPETFASTARIKLERMVAKAPENGLSKKLRTENDSGDLSNPDPLSTQEIRTIAEIIPSEQVLDLVIDALDLNKVWTQKYNTPSRLKNTESRELLKRMIFVRPVRGTSLVDITVCSDDRDEAAKIANSMAEQYSNYLRRREQMLLIEPLNDYKKLRTQMRSELAGKTEIDDAKIIEMIQRVNALYQAATDHITVDWVEIVEHAQSGVRPVRPNKPLNIAIGIVMGTIAGAVVAGTVVMLGILMRKPPMAAQGTASPP